MATPKTMTNEELLRAACPNNPDWHIENVGRDLMRSVLWMIRRLPAETQGPLLQGAVDQLLWAAGKGPYPQPLERGRVKAAPTRRTGRG